MVLIAGTLDTLATLILPWGGEWGLTFTSLLSVFFVPVMNYSRDLRIFKVSSAAPLVFEHIFFLMDSDLMQIKQHLSLISADEPQKGTKGSTGQFLWRK